jgi:hypothetical protein
MSTSQRATRRRSFVHVSFGVGLLLLGSISCDATEPVRREAQLTSLQLSGAAAAAVGADGQFVLPGPKSLNGESIITEARARRLALAYVRVYGQAYLPSWEADRGGPISLSRLSASSRVYFAQSPYGSVPRNDVHAAYRRRFGPYYLFALVDGPTPVVAFAVSALATDYSVDAQGRLVSPAQTGMDFLHEGIPLDGSFGILSPEEAVHVAAAASGARVTGIPELVLTNSDDAPTIARWRVQLDRDVRAVGRSGNGRRTSTVFVGGRRSDRFAIEAEGDVSAHQERMLVRGARNQRGTENVSVPIQAGRKVRFQAVNLTAEED